MKTHDLIELATRNLRESVLRNSLTTIGISVGVASLVSMLSLGIGLQRLASKRLEKSGLFDTVSVSPRREGRGFNREPAGSRILDESARQEIEHVPNVVEAYPDIRFPAELRYDNKPFRTTVSGVPASAKASDAYDGIRGSFFSSENAPEVILQKWIAAELLGRMQRSPEPDAGDLARNLVGKQLAVTYAERSVATDGAAFSVVPRTQSFKIVGVVDVDPEGILGPGRARVFLPLKFAQSINAIQFSEMRDSTRAVAGTPAFTALRVRVRDPSEVQRVEETIKKMGFSTFSILDATRSLQRLFAVLDLFLGAFGSLALAVASIGIVNTLVMAILERRREIGIMKAIGASDTDVRRIFFAEAGAMGVLGGALGVGLGWAIGKAINFGTNFYLERQGFPTEQMWFVPWWLVVGAIAFALIVSLASGWYPAARASRLDPVQALRYE